MTPITLTSNQIVILSFLATGGLCILWIAFWIAVRTSGEKVSEILLNQSFFKTVTVMGVIAGVVVLALAGRIDGDLTASIFAGIVGYVLGATKVLGDK